MAEEHAVPEENSEKMHGDKLSGALNASAGKNVAGSPTGGGQVVSHAVQAESDDIATGDLQNNPSDGRPMP